jgi:hypothetical protein
MPARLRVQLRDLQRQLARGLGAIGGGVIFSRPRDVAFDLEEAAPAFPRGRVVRVQGQGATELREGFFPPACSV